MVCQSLFSLSDKREDNFIGGLSMGAHGAMKIALMQPERFQAALIMSGAAKHVDILDEMKKMMERKDPDIMPMIDMEIIYGGFDKFKNSEHDAYYIARKNIEQEKSLPEFFFACGLDDFALSHSKLGYQELTDLGYQTSLELVPGYGHEWDFWDLILRKAIAEWLPIKHEVIYP